MTIARDSWIFGMTVAAAVLAFTLIAFTAAHSGPIMSASSPHCTPAVYLTLTTPDGRLATFSVTQIAEVLALEHNAVGYSPKAHAIIIISSGFAQAVQEQWQTIYRLLDPCDLELKTMMRLGAT